MRVAGGGGKESSMLSHRGNAERGHAQGYFIKGLRGN